MIRFRNGEAAKKRFVWSDTQLGKVLSSSGLRYTIDGRHHTFTASHAMPEAAMIGAGEGFKLTLHDVRDGEDFVRSWDMAPGREEIMTAVHWDAPAQETGP